MQNAYRKVFFLATILVLLVGLSAISATSIDDNTTTTNSHVDIEKHVSTGIVKEDTKTVSHDNKNAVKENKKTTNKKVKSSTQHDYYVSTSGDDDEDGSNSTPYKTINRAISQATSTSDTYNIHIKEGTYTGTGNTNLTVNGDYKINFIGDGINKTVLDGEVQYTEGSASVWGNDPNFNSYNIISGNWGMNITNGNGRIRISNLNIQHMVSPGGNDINAYPTATIDNHATLDVDNVYFYDNLAGVGAGIRNNNDGSLTVTNSIFEANRKSSTTGNYGAGIYNNGTASVFNSQFIGNIARWGTVTNDYAIDIINCTFRDGIAYNAASTFKYGSAIASNTGQSNYFHIYNGTNGLVTNVINSTFINNQQTDIYQGQGNLLVDNCKFEHSTGIYIAPETVNNASFTHVIENSSFDNMIPSSVLYSWSNTKNITFAVYDVSQSSTAITNNNISTSSDAYALYLNNSNIVTDNSINGYVYIIGKNNKLQANNITSENRTYTIELTDTAQENNITNNNLVASIFTGDASVKTVNNNNIVKNNKGNRAKIITVNAKNYYRYFDGDNGYINRKEVPDGSTLIFDSLSNKNLHIYGAKIYITSKNNTELTDCSIEISEDAQVTIHGLNIVANNNNWDTEYVIGIYSKYNTIDSSTIKTSFATPIILYQNNGNNIIFNNTISANSTSFTAISVQSANNTIIQNNIITSTSDDLIESIILDTETATNNIIANNIIHAESSDATAITLSEGANNNTIDNNIISISAENNAIAINVQNSNDNEIKSIIRMECAGTARGVLIQNGKNNKINGIIIENITAQQASAIKLYKANNTIITANDTTNPYVLYSDNARIVDIEQSNNTQISYITPIIFGNGTVFNIVNAYNTSIETVNCTYTTESEYNGHVKYVLATQTNGIYIGRLIRDNFTQSAVINAINIDDEPITIMNSENIEINGITIYTYKNYTIVLVDTNNTLIVGNKLISYNLTTTGHETIYEENTQNTTYKEDQTASNILKHLNSKNKSIKSKTMKSLEKGDIRYEATVTPNIVAPFSQITISGFLGNYSGTKWRQIKSSIYYKVDDGKVYSYGVKRNCTFLFNLTASGVSGIHNITLYANHTYKDGIHTYGMPLQLNYTVIKNTGDKNTTLTVNVTNTTIGSPIIINGMLLDSDDKTPINNTDISITIGMDLGNRFSVEKEVNVTTDANGKYTYSCIAQDADQRKSVKVVFVGNKDYNNNQIITVFAVDSSDLVTMSVNNYEELCEAMGIRTKQLIINLNDFQYDFSKPDIRGYIIDKNASIASDNTIINGNNQVLIGNTNNFINYSGSKGFELTINDLKIENCSSSAIYASPMWDKGDIILNNVTFEGNGEPIINLTNANIQLVNCTILDSQKVVEHDGSTIIIDNCYIEGIVDTQSNIITHNTTINLQVPETVKIGDSVVINGTLLNDMNGPGKLLRITLNVDGKQVRLTTDDEGRFAYVYTPKSVKQNVRVNTIFNGTDYHNYAYNSSTRTVRFNIEEINTNIDDIKINNIAVNSTGNITGRLVDERNTPIANATIYVAINNNTYNTTTDSKGVFIAAITAPDTSGIHSITINYDGNEVYNKTGSTVNITVEKLETDIKLDSVTPVKTGENITITGKVIDETNTTVPDAQLNIIIENRTYTAISDNNGTFTANIRVTGVGLQELTVIYNGDSQHTASNMTGNYTVNKQDTNIIIEPVNTIIGENMSIITHITDENNQTIKEGQVFFKINDKTLKDINGNNIYVDVINGTAVMNYQVNSIKISNITAVYTGSEHYNTIRNTTAIQIERTNATMKLEILNHNIKPGETAIIKVTLTDKYANLINSGKVIFKLNGKTLKDENNETITVRIHNGEAIFNYTIPANISAKNYTLTAVSVGNTYNRVETTTNLTLTKINTYIQPVNTQFTGNTLQVRANIISTTTFENIAYRTIKVTVKINNKTFVKETEITNGTIDLDIDTSSIGKGNYRITIKTGDNGIYTGTTFNTYTYKAPVKQALNQTSENGTLVKA